MRRKIQLVLLFFSFLQISFAQESRKNIVIHTVEQGQTIYSIAKTYNLKPEDIQAQNPAVDSTFAIQPGQILRIEAGNDAATEEILNQLEKTPIVHLVQPKETLYSLSKLHSVPMEDLREWNSLANNDIKIDQELVVGWKFTSGSNVPAVLKTDSPKPEQRVAINNEAVEEENILRAKPEAAQKSTSFSSTNKQEVLKQRFLVSTADGTDAKKEGVAIWFNTDNRMMSSTYYGLFSDADVGSVVKVTNLMNNNVVFVKVIGGLPDTAENAGAMIKLTSAARDVLRTSDGKIRVRVEYAR